MGAVKFKLIVGATARISEPLQTFKVSSFIALHEIELVR